MNQDVRIDGKALLEIEQSEFAAGIAGARIAMALKLKIDPDHPDRWVLGEGWGNKTNVGLARTVLRILQGDCP